MKRFLFSLLLCASAVAQAPLAHNSFTTNAPGKTPPLLTTSTSPLYPLMVLLPDGSGADRTVAWAPQFFMSNGVAHFTGLINDTALSGNTLLRIDAGKNINNMIGGSPGALAKWTSTGLIGNSVMTDDGTSINVNNLAVSNQLALQWLSNVIPRINGSGQVSGTTIGSNLSFDGVTLSANGDTIWTNDAGVTHPVDLTIPVVIGTTANTYGNNFYIYTPTNGSSGYAHTIVTGAPFLATGLSVDLLGDNYTGTWGEGFYAGNLLPAINGDRAMYYNVGQYGILGEVNPQVSTNGQTIGVFGVSDGYGSVQYGLSGMAQAFDNGQTNIGVAGTSLRNSKTGVFVGGYFEANDTTSADPNYESATLLLDNRATALPLLTARTNNGTTVFQVGAKGSVLLSDSAKLGDYYIYPLKAGNGISLSTNANPTSGTNLTATVTNVTEAQLTLAANTTADVSTTKHGFAPVLPNDSTKFLNGVGTYTVPAGGISGSGTANRVAKWSSSSAIGNATPTDDGSIWDFGNVMSTVRIPDGSAPVPGLAFSIQTNLGIARLADTALSIIAGGAEVAAFGNGNFGSYNGLKFSSTATMKMPSGAGAGKVLTSDAAGSASWQNILSVNTTNVTTPNLQDTATVTWARSGSNLTATAVSSGGGTPGFTIGANYIITANQTNMDNGTLGTNSFMIIGGSSIARTNGDNLLSAYAWAKTATPLGSAKAANNHFTIFLLPGTYDLGSGTLTMDTLYIDVIGLSRNTGQTKYVGAWTDRGDTIITSSGDVIKITAAGGATALTVANVCLETTGASTFAFRSTVDLGADFRLINVLIRAATLSVAKEPMSYTGIDYGGYYEDVRCWYENSFSGADANKAASGTFIRCKAGPYSFGATASGVFIDCEADGCSFGRTTCSGQFYGCRGVTINGTGCALFADNGTLSGACYQCDTSVFGQSMGTGGGGITGSLYNCSATSFGAVGTTAVMANCTATSAGTTYNTTRVKTQAKADTAGTVVTAGGTLKVNTTTTGNVGGGTDNLITFTVPAGQLSVNGDYLEFDCAGTFAATVNAKTLNVVFGSTTLLTTGSLVLNGLDWRAHGRIVRTGAATQKATTEMTIGGTLLSAVNSTITDYTTPAETLSGTVVFKCTGSDDGGVPADNAVVQEMMVLKWYPGQ